MYKTTYQVNGGTYDDGLLVDNRFVFGLLMKRSFRAIAEGDCHRVTGIRDHLLEKGFKHTSKQISSALQRLKNLDMVCLTDSRWSLNEKIERG